ncbi:MEDS domain-containing protein [Actinomadura kijaniata]|uniref:MEDS domain-containing protein n=1 Tax=Actinomadura kijaniata TaxID=46161 RepID=UPI00082FBD77|nr:MEDS domain-containing protein [Actinomadura kijaniata]
MTSAADGRPHGPATSRGGAKPVSEVTFGDHLCLTFDNDPERYAILGAYIRDGLALHHKIIYLADEDDAGAVLRRLGDGIAGAWVPGTERLDLDAAVAEGRLAIRPIVDAFMATGRFDPDETVALLATEIEVALVQGYAGVRISGETSFSLRGWPGTDRFADFEQRCQAAFQTPGLKAMALCQYDSRWFSRAQLEELELCHGGRVRVDDLYDDGVLRITPLFTPPGLALDGAVDESTVQAVGDALERMAARASHFCLDLSGLEFCDMEGLRTLIGAGRSGGVHRQVILRGVPDYLDLMLRISGWDSMPDIYREGVRR